MVTSRYTLKETKEFNKCFNEILSYIDKLKIDELKKNEKKRIDKIYEQVNKCTKVIDEKEIKNKNNKNKLNYYNIYTMDANNVGNNKLHLNILSDDIKNKIISQKDDKSNLLTRYAKLWKLDIDEKTKKEYIKLTKNKSFLKSDYDELIVKGVKTTPKFKRKEITKV
jgi:hypothetical protein